MRTSVRRDAPASLTALLALTVVWGAVLTGLLAPWAPPWGLGASTSPPITAGAELATLFARAAVLGAGLVWTCVALPFFLLAWLAVPKRERRTFPWLVAAWVAGGACAALTLAGGASDRLLLAVLAVPPIVTLEVLRVLLTSFVHRLTTPWDAPTT